VQIFGGGRLPDMACCFRALEPGDEEGGTVRTAAALWIQGGIVGRLARSSPELVAAALDTPGGRLPREAILDGRPYPQLDDAGISVNALGGDALLVSEFREAAPDCPG